MKTKILILAAAIFLVLSIALAPMSASAASNVPEKERPVQILESPNGQIRYLVFVSPFSGVTKIIILGKR